MKKRNIRQIGQIKGARNIYIEDYAMSYLKQMAEPGASGTHMAVLVGEVEKEGREEAVYVYGVLELPPEGQEVGWQGIDYQLDSAAWTRLYAEMGKHFPDREIVGWYLTGEELIPEKNERLLRFHRENFVGEHKIFFYYNPLELEEIGYFYEEGQLKPQSGYYIFYEKNEAMQNLLVAKNQETSWRSGMLSERGQETESWNGFRDARTTGMSQRGMLQSGMSQDSYSGRSRYMGERGYTRQAEAFRQDGAAGNMGQAEPYGGWQHGNDQNNISESEWPGYQEKKKGRKSEGRRGGGKVSSYLAGMATAVAVLALCLVALQYFDRLDGLEESIRQLTGNLSDVTTMGQTQDGQEEQEGQSGANQSEDSGKESNTENTEQNSDHIITSGRGDEGNMDKTGTDETNQSEEAGNTKEGAKTKEEGSVLEVETVPGGIREDSEENETEEEETKEEETKEEETEGIEPADDENAE